MTAEWMWTTWHEVWLIAASAAVIVIAVVAAVRLVGLRSLSKMSSHDFVVTVALGSVVAAVASSPTSLANGVLAIGALLGIQAVIARARRREKLGHAIDNTPVLLVRSGVYCRDAMASCRVTERDIVAKLREANVLDPARALAVVLESTGDISVLHGDGPLDPALLDGVCNGDWNPSEAVES